MEHIGQILERATDSLKSQSESGNEKVAYKEVKIEDCTCQECGTTFQGEVTYFQARPGKPYPPQFCPECEEKKKQEEEAKQREETELEREVTRERWRRTCGFEKYPELRLKTFDNFKRERNPVAHDAALAWAEEYNVDAPRGYRSLLFFSDVAGVGKTHLVAAIINYIIDNWQGDNFIAKRPCLFVKGPQLVRRIRATYNIRTDDNEHEREDEVYAELSGVPVLVLDDVGKETASNFTRETYWYIVDERVTSGLPVIITSKYPLDGNVSLERWMGEDTVDRVYGMVGGEAFKMRGPSYRRDTEKA